MTKGAILFSSESVWRAGIWQRMWRSMRLPNLRRNTCFHGGHKERKQVQWEAAHAMLHSDSVWPASIAWPVVAGPIWQLKITVVLSVLLNIHSFDNNPLLSSVTYVCTHIFHTQLITNSFHDNGHRRFSSVIHRIWVWPFTRADLICTTGRSCSLLGFDTILRSSLM